MLGPSFAFDSSPTPATPSNTCFHWLNDGFPAVGIQHSLLKRVGHMILASVVIRCNYYFAWILADGANNVAGLGFLPGKNHKGTWDHISNVNVANVEFATSFKMVLDNWNIQTQVSSRLRDQHSLLPSVCCLSAPAARAAKFFGSRLSSLPTV